MRRRRKVITLKYAGKCKDCGASLEPGDRARWYGRGRIYGVDCHEDERQQVGMEGQRQKLADDGEYGHPVTQDQLFG